MSDRYQGSNDCYDISIWECDENGTRIREMLFEEDIVAELNRLATLADDAANMARLDERNKIQQAMFRENIGLEQVQDMKEHTPSVYDTCHGLYSDSFITVRRDYWNRMVRAFKSIAAGVHLS
jgi:hypothetical protein